VYEIITESLARAAALFSVFDLRSSNGPDSVTNHNVSDVDIMILTQGRFYRVARGTTPPCENSAPPGP